MKQKMSIFALRQKSVFGGFTILAAKFALSVKTLFVALVDCDSLTVIMWNLVIPGRISRPNKI